MSTAHSPEPSVPMPASPSVTAGFSRAKTLEDLAGEQGVVPVERAEDLLGQGQDLWDDDADFDRFLVWLRESRRCGE
jgi:hypothetical protein